MSDDTASPADLLNKLSQALILVSRGDPLVSLRAELQTEFRAINTRFSEIDKATELQHDDMVRVPTQVDRAVQNLRELLEQTVQTAIAQTDVKIERHIAETTQKFIGIANQFIERDTRDAQHAGDTKLAVDAAFAAADKAAAKIETGFAGLIRGMDEKIDAKADSNASEISNLKDRLADLKDILTALQSRTDATSPAMTNALREVTDLRLSARQQQGQGIGQAQLIGWLVAAAVVGGAAMKLLGHG